MASLVVIPGGLEICGVSVSLPSSGAFPSEVYSFSSSRGDSGVTRFAKPLHIVAFSRAPRP